MRDAISMLKEDGVKNIKFLCIIAAPEGIKMEKETVLVTNERSKI